MRGASAALQKLVLENPGRWPFFDKALAANGGKWPTEAGRAWQVHHIKPISAGGLTVLDNLVPLPPSVHDLFSKWWMKIWWNIRNRFTDTEWKAIYTTGKKVVAGP